MLNLSQSEKRIIFLIAGVIILSCLFYVFGSYGRNTDIIDYSESDSIFSRLTHQSSPSESLYQTSDKQKINNKHIISHTPQKSFKTERGSIDINLANKDELVKLPRIGPAMANRIIEYREINGPFSSHNELTKVKGIGKKTLELIKPYLRNID
jgi:comEA protein